MLERFNSWHIDRKAKLEADLDCLIYIQLVFWLRGFQDFLDPPLQFRAVCWSNGDDERRNQKETGVGME